MHKVVWNAAGLAAAFLFFAVGSTNAQQSEMNMSGMDHDMSTMADEGVEHDHPARPVDPDLPIPSITHLAFPDAMDGYNVQILVQNFTFTPAAINRDVVANEGHAHIYINGVKIARVYGNWYHVPSSLFSPGVNALTVTLNANDHSTWANPDGDLIASTVPVIRPSSGN
ncbi:MULTISPECIES: hypothetical protein [Pacificibacter]|uniref:hypothetical protein n=1 Tax=Pacificibacter TaxID=1042323 RepID=UPI001C0958EC|nr:MULTISPECIES: hypothetical protein [Pacificibacter]MBU2936457.1 hypothetical protein [Pacificibacter marinus]MDO6614742.1 hypothetical protein [Pacificibacter sp. 1_MG-2023]